MQRLTLLFLVAILGVPGKGKAQLPAAKSALPAPPANSKPVLQGSANARFVVLVRLTPLYRQPADTLSGRYALRPGPGTRVYLRKTLAQGYLVTLAFDGPKQYYLPYKLVANLPTQVEI